ncbi:S1C family serine protease [Corynebacterium confusum]|uniref:S1C family serine protease n=1 Tax=uncultured Corynebacterium sp. TaxID=159447 RepID=UPI00260130EA|nr:trypsin-like peptidase domain-containing protein [uncultured Corynebacterium sp.]
MNNNNPHNSEPTGSSSPYGQQGQHQSQSQGWNQPRTSDAQPTETTRSWQSADAQWGQPQPHAQPQAQTQPQPQTQPHPQAQTQAQPQYQPGAPGAVAEQPKKKRSVGLGTALAMMLVVAIGAGGVTGAAVGGSGSNDSTSTVNEVLNRPANNESAPAPAEGSIEEVSQKVLPAVVAIQVVTRAGAAEGSGSLISPDGYVLTNHHVVEGSSAGAIQVTMNDGSRKDAEVVASDANTDVAVIKIKDAENLPYLEFADSDQLNVGQQVVAVGSPLGLNATVTSGIVSAVNRPVRASQAGGEPSLIDAVQTDAAVNPGNSGGPLVDMNGNIVGMNSVIASLSSSSGQEAGSIGLGFAIPSNFAKRMADQLINNGEVKHPMLGVQVDGRNLTQGAPVVKVEEGSPAAEAGIKAGDVITRLGDRPIEDSDTLIAGTRSQDFGATVTLEVLDPDSEETRQVEVTLSSE